MKKKKETFTRWDAAEHLHSEEEIAAYLQACADEDDPQLMIAALGDIARARGIQGLAQETGLTRMGLYKALSENGNPSYATVAKVAHALGLRISVTAS